MAFPGLLTSLSASALVLDFEAILAAAFFYFGIF
jgi:hypothetical protein